MGRTFPIWDILSFEMIFPESRDRSFSLLFKYKKGFDQNIVNLKINIFQYQLANCIQILQLEIVFIINKKYCQTNKMFHFHQDNFELEESFSNLKPLANDLPTTTHNSPGSFKSGSLKLQDSPFNCSFDQRNQVSHANAVWEASIKYLTSALSDFVDTSKGFNDSNLYRFMNEDCQEKDLDQTIFRNSNLKIQQKHQFISDLHTQTQLKGLMGQLLKLFNEEIFHELTYVVFKIWEKKNRTQNQQKNIFAPQEPLVPQFNCFWGYEDQEVQKDTFSPFFEEKNIEQVILKADKCTQQISNDLFFDRKIKLLNLRESKNCNGQTDIPSLFGQFFKQVSRSVFLSVEGFFEHPSENKMCEQYETFDFDFQMNQVSALEQLQVQNRFVRSFSQDFEDDEQDFEFDSAPKKKRKLQ